jgi:hypothetical protein
MLADAKRHVALLLVRGELGPGALGPYEKEETHHIRVGETLRLPEYNTVIELLNVTNSSAVLGITSAGRVYTNGYDYFVALPFPSS